MLDAPQARHPGKLRKVHFRDFEFAVPEFPRLHADEDGLPTQPPPNLGEHTADVLKSAGVDRAEYEALLGSSAIAEDAANAFAWAEVRRKAEAL